MIVEYYYPLYATNALSNIVKWTAPFVSHTWLIISIILKFYMLIDVVLQVISVRGKSLFSFTE